MFLWDISLWVWFLVPTGIRKFLSSWDSRTEFSAIFLCPSNSMLYIFRNYIKVLLANAFVYHWFQVKYQFYNWGNTVSLCIISPKFFLHKKIFIYSIRKTIITLKKTVFLLIKKSYMYIYALFYIYETKW